MGARLALAGIDRQRLVAGSTVLLAAAALWIALLAWMDGDAVHGAPTCLGLTFDHIGETTAMWVVMMAAMMLPAATPAIAMFASFAGRDAESHDAGLRSWLFASGYLVVWSLVSVVFAVAQISLARSGTFAEQGTLAGPLGAGLLLLAAGAYELTALKQACLTRCRNPLTYLIGNWRDGALGALRLGAGHGVHCVGCCAAMMGLMFVFGAMNMVWMAVLAAWFVLEKIVPRAHAVSRYAGFVLLGAGALLTGTVLAGAWPA
ncbi:MAG: DUF2182 domain-containing protein [Rhodobiaceae bacterium]|nr:DUF2182 domain-containing protein [Rhodobiaceae bacterium]MCC0015353.1 DUF2182 domain-containing protein [Rhodobiaceae bacterium]MCC0042006.1 DUF2182 domain-containing protein [Rhodobiaceae bacterium]MCC0053408.1 DUF2182 domain-containing protein [Rhodobiaceae bacterium]